MYLWSEFCHTATPSYKVSWISFVFCFLFLAILFPVFLEEGKGEGVCDGR